MASGSHSGVGATAGAVNVDQEGSLAA